MNRTVRNGVIGGAAAAGAGQVIGSAADRAGERLMHEAPQTPTLADYKSKVNSGRRLWKTERALHSVPGRAATVATGVAAGAYLAHRHNQKAAMSKSIDDIFTAARISKLQPETKTGAKYGGAVSAGMGAAAGAPYGAKAAIASGVLGGISGAAEGAAVGGAIAHDRKKQIGFFRPKKPKVEEGVDKRFFSAASRRKLAGNGDAMKDGSFPIKNTKDLKNAERLVGRAKNPAAAEKHIEERAKDLGVSKRDESLIVNHIFAKARGEVSKAVFNDAAEAASRIAGKTKKLGATAVPKAKSFANKNPLKAAGIAAGAGAVGGYEAKKHIL